MELKQFIKSVLKDITEAVEETRTASSRDLHLDSVKDQRTVEFDVAVTAEDMTSTAGKAGVKVFSIIEGGGEAAKEVKNSTVSRIRFGVHVDRWTKQENAGFDTQNRRVNSGYNDAI
jgi:hypothetical protein